ncbi:MAG: hypothetical protein R6W70_09840 [bacterium]
MKPAQIKAFLFREIKENGTLFAVLFTAMTVFSGFVRLIFIVLLVSKTLPANIENGRSRIFSSLPFTKNTVFFSSLGLSLFTSLTSALLHTLIFKNTPVFTTSYSGIYSTITDETGLITAAVTTLFFFGLSTAGARKGLSSIGLSAIVIIAIYLLTPLSSVMGIRETFEFFNPLRSGTEIFNPVMPIIYGVFLTCLSYRMFSKGGMSR